MKNERPKRLSARQSLDQHWPEYLIEAAALGIFMLSAAFFTTWLEAPRSWARQAIANADLRRGLIGVAMGSTAMALIYSPWGKRSGAHMNPAITLTYLSLRKIPLWDALFYIVFQFVGGVAGVLIASYFLGTDFRSPPVDYVVTVPGEPGTWPAFAGEFVIGLIMMAMIATVSNKPEIAKYTGLLAGLLIACFVECEAPLSGFGMNPARTFASALPSEIWRSIWLYFTAAPLGMLLAGLGYTLLKGGDSVRCCKLHHDSKGTCIFCGQRSGSNLP